MRARPALLIAAIFASAAALTVFVVSQLPLEGEVSPLPAFAEPPAAAGTTPPLEAGLPTDGALELRVTAGGEPLAGAEVRAYLALPAADPGAGPAWRRAGIAVSAPGGVARLEAPAGAYLVAVRAPGLAPARRALVRAAGEGTARADVALEPPARLAGTVRDGAGNPISGARVLVLPADPADAGAGPGPAPLLAAPPEETPAVTTDAAGGFEVGGLAPGLHALAAEAEGRHPARLERVAVPRDGPISIVLEPLGALTGTVTLDGRPAAGVAVLAASRDHAARSVTGADGRFTLAVRAGGYRLAAALGDRSAGAGPLAVAAGAPTEVGLALGPAAVLEGLAVDAATGQPVAGAAVTLALHETGAAVARATSGPDGRFRVGGLAPGGHDLAASAPGRGPARAPALTFAPGQRFPLRLALEATGAVGGTVVDGAGRAVAGARVRLVTPGDALAPGASHDGRTDFDGRFGLTGVAAGRAELSVHQDAVAAGVALAVQVPAGGEARAAVILPEPGLVAGRVTFGGRRPPAGTAVVAVPARGGPGAGQTGRTLADATGNFRLALPAGDWRVHAAAADEARTDARAAPAHVRVEPNRTTRLELALAPAGPDALVIQILEPGGAPSAGAEVTLGRAGDGTVALATAAGEDGCVALPGNMALGGRAAAVRARNGGRTGAWEGTLPERGTVVVRLAPAGALSGEVRAQGRAVSGFTLEVASRPATGAWRTLDVHRFAGDRFALGDLPAEPVRIVVRADDGRRGEAEVALGAGATSPVVIAVR